MMSMRSEVVITLPLFVGGLLMRAAWSFKPSDQPGLPQLQQFTTKGGDSINLLEGIGVQYESFGTCLLDDDLGVKMSAIQSNHRSVDSKMRDIFTKWLQGSGKRPETWATIVSCLRAINLNYIADKIEQQYQTDSNTNIDTGTAGRESASSQTQPVTEGDRGSEDEIEDVRELMQAVKDIGDWRALCMNLKVENGIMDSLVHSADHNHTKKMECLQAYIDGGEARWTEVVRAVAKYPVNNKRVAKQIAKAHNIDFNRVMKDEL